MKTKQLLVMMFALAMLASCKETPYIANPGDVDMSGDSKEIKTEKTDDNTAVLEAIEVLKAKGERVYTTDEAIKICKSMPSGVDSNERYYVYGYISNMGTGGDNGGWLNAQYGNGYYYLKTSATSQSSFYCYRILYKNKEKYTSTDQAYEGQWVLINCMLKNYNGTYETGGNSDAYVVACTEKVITTTGDGSEAKPYTMEDVLALGGQINGQDVWFKGVIAGCVNSNNILEQENFTIQTNFAVAASLENAAAATSVRVDLKVGKVGSINRQNQDALAPYNKPENLGKEVLVKGKIELGKTLAVSEFETVIFENMVYTQTEEPKAK